MASIDERVVSISFENAKFEAAIKQTIASLGKLNEALKLVGAVNGLQSIEKASNNVKMTTAQVSADNLKKKADFSQSAKSLKGVEDASNQVKLSGAAGAADQAQTRFQKLGDTARNALNTVKGAVTRSPSVAPPVQIHGANGQFQAIEAASHQVKLAGITTAIQNAEKGFTVLKGAASVALGGIAASAARAGASVGRKALSPITQGFSEYEGNINATQTILSNVKGQKGGDLKSVNAALAELNTYADKTIFKFGDMTKGAGIFTAAGVGIKDAIPSIKGVSNLLALAGSDASKAAPLMTQLSQALASGKVGLQDYASINAAGIGGKTFQKAVVQQAQSMGLLKGKVDGLNDPLKKLTINGESFRESISAKSKTPTYFTSDVLAKVLRNFSGDVTTAQLVAEGYTKAQARVAVATAKTAYSSATVVKTFSGLMDTTKEAIGSGFSTSFQLLLGNFGQAKTLFTGLNTVIGGFVQKVSKSRNALLKQFQDLGGRTLLITALSDAFDLLGTILTTIGKAYRAVFPKSTAKELLSSVKGFQDLVKAITPGQLTLARLTQTFGGFFAILSIGKQAVGALFHLIGRLFGLAGSNSGGFLKLTSVIGVFFIQLDRAIKSGKSFHEVLATLPAILRAPLALLSNLGQRLKNLFSGKGFKADSVTNQFDTIKQSLQPFNKLVEKAKSVWEAFTGSFSRLFQRLQPAFAGIGAAFSHLGDSIVNSLNNANYTNVFQAINTGLLGGIVLLFKKFLKGGVLGEAGSGFFANINKSLGAVTGTLVTMQKNVQASILIKIAVAVGILALSILVLSTINPKNLDKAMSAMTLAFTQLVIAMSILTKISAGAGAVKLPFLAAGLVLVAIALGLLVLSVKALSNLNYDQLKKGLGGVAALMIIMAAAAIPLSKAGPKIIFAGIGMLLIATAMRILTKAIADFGKMDPKAIGKGLATMAGALLIIVAAVNLIPPKLPLIAYGLIYFALGMKLLSKSIIALSGLSWKEIGRGLGTLAGGLAVIAVAVAVLPKTLFLQAAGLLIVSLAIGKIAAALIVLSKLGPVQILTSLYSLGGAFAVLAGGLYALNGAYIGAGVLFVAAHGLAALVPVILTLGNLPLKTLLQGLGGIVVGLGALAATAILLSPAIPTLLALGVAVIAIGIGIGAATKGIASLVNAITGLFKVLSKIGGGGPDFGKIFGAFGAGVKSFGNGIIAVFHNLVVEIPKSIGNFILGIGKVITAIAGAAPKFVQGVVTLLNAVLNIVIVTAPKLGLAILVLVNTILTVLRSAIPNIITTAILLINALLKGLDGNAAGFVTMAGHIIVNILNALALQIPAIVQAGGNLIVSFLSGLATQLPRMITAGANLIVHFLQGLTNAVPRIVTSAVNLIVAFAGALASHAGQLIDAGAHLLVKVMQGLGRKSDRVATAASNMVGDFLAAAANAMLTLTKRIAHIVINFLNGLAKAINDNSHQINAAGLNVAKALVSGMADGMSQLGHLVIEEAKKLAGHLPHWVRRVLNIHSPSKVLHSLGRYAAQGFANGIGASAGAAKTAATGMAQGVVDGVTSVPLTKLQRTMRDISGALSANINMDPTITPVLDLSSVEAGAKQLGDLTNVTPITAAASFGQATAISAEQQAAAADAATAASDAAAAAPAPIQFIQKNSSPESLSTAEIYRQTRNQLSMAKDMLGVPPTAKVG
jgi:Tape measure protein